MAEYVSVDDIRKELKDRCQGWGGQRRFAREAGVSNVLVSDMINGYRPIGGKVAEALGVKRVVLFEALTDGRS